MQQSKARQGKREDNPTEKRKNKASPPSKKEGNRCSVQQQKRYLQVDTVGERDGSKDDALHVGEDVGHGVDRAE